MKVKKDKMYSVRLNRELVEKVRSTTGMSPQNMIDSKYQELSYVMKIEDEKEEQCPEEDDLLLVDL